MSAPFLWHKWCKLTQNLCQPILKGRARRPRSSPPCWFRHRLVSFSVMTFPFFVIIWQRHLRRTSSKHRTPSITSVRLLSPFRMSDLRELAFALDLERLAKQETLTLPGRLVSPLVCRGQWMSTVLYCWCCSDGASVLLYFTFLSHLFPLPCGAGSTVPRERFDSVLLRLFHGVLWLWHYLHSVGPHPVSSLHIYTFVVLRAFVAGAAS